MLRRARAAQALLPHPPLCDGRRRVLRPRAPYISLNLPKSPCISKVDETQATAAFLGGVPLFSSLTPDQITQLASEVQPRKVSTGAFIVREGERAESLFFVREGQVTNP